MSDPVSGGDEFFNDILNVRVRGTLKINGEIVNPSGGSYVQSVTASGSVIGVDNSDPTNPTVGIAAPFIGAGATAVAARTAIGIPTNAGATQQCLVAAFNTLALVTLSNTAQSNAVARYNVNGALVVNTALNANEAATLAQINARLSATQRNAIDALNAGTATVADVVNALKAV